MHRKFHENRHFEDDRAEEEQDERGARRHRQEVVGNLLEWLREHLQEEEHERRHHGHDKLEDGARPEGRQDEDADKKQLARRLHLERLSRRL